MASSSLPPGLFIDAEELCRVFHKKLNKPAVPAHTGIEIRVFGELENQCRGFSRDSDLNVAGVCTVMRAVNDAAPWNHSIGAALRTELGLQVHGHE